MSKTLRQRRGVFVLMACLISSIAGAQRIGDVYASDATVKGSVRYTSTGLEVDNGSVITAGQHSASVRLARGGQVRICPGTNLTVNSSPKGQELMFAMSAGSFEGEYDLPPTADAILTPDFRILISGPAKVNVSITAWPSVRRTFGLPLSQMGPFLAASVCGYLVSSFSGGAVVRRVGVGRLLLGSSLLIVASLCGYAAAPVPSAPASQVATPSIATPPPETRPAPTPQQKAAALAAVQNEPAVAAAASAAASLPQQSAAQVQVQVDAPMVFRGASTATDGDVTATLARVHIERLPWPETPTITPQPPSASKAKVQTNEKKGFFHRLAKALFG